MMTNLVCVDANITLKLILAEPNSFLAVALWEEWSQQDVTIIAPYLWGYEVTSVIRNQIHRRKLSVALGLEAFSVIHQLPIQLIHPDNLYQRAWSLANHFNRPAAYDAHYLAVAEIMNCPFWTADERLFNAVSSELSWGHWLGNYSTSQQ